MLDKKECAQWLYSTDFKKQKVWGVKELKHAKAKLKLINKQIKRV